MPGKRTTKRLLDEIGSINTSRRDHPSEREQVAVQPLVVDIHLPIRPASGRSGCPDNEEDRQEPAKGAARPPGRVLHHVPSGHSECRSVGRQIALGGREGGPGRRKGRLPAVHQGRARPPPEQERFVTR